MIFLKFVLFSYVLALHIFLAFIILNPDIADKITEQISTHHPESKLGDHYHQMVTFQSRADKNVPIDAVVFIGDSIIQGLAVSAVAPVSENFGIGKDTTEGVLKRIESLHSLKGASIVVMAVGINDLKYRSNGAIALNYKRILEAIDDHQSILANAIFPVDEGILMKPGYNARIENLNKLISIACDAHEKCSFLDLGSDFSNPTGQLDSNFHIGDGLHLNAEGYELWIEKLKAALLLLASER